MNRLSLPDRTRVRAALAAHFRRSEQGITLAIFAVALVVLLMFVALGVDGSRIYDERRQAQNAADHAAIAAAYASCTTEDADVVSVAQAAGYDSADQNGYDDNGTTNDVTIAIEPGAAAGDHEYRATIDTTIGTTFANVMGFAELATTTTATARATGCDATAAGTGPGALFAGGDTCTDTDKPGIDISGSNQRVYGGVHSNASARVGGGSNIFSQAGDPDDPFTYVHSLASGSIGNGNVYQTGYPLDVGPTTEPWPSDYEPGDIGAGGSPPPAGSFLRAYYDLADANGTTAANDTLFTTKVDSITKNGVYYTTDADGFDVSSISAGVTNFVLVAPNGPIKVSGGVDNRTFNPFNDPSLPRQGVLMISNKQYSGTDKCDKYTIAISGSNTSWNGILWAPGGLVEFSGSSNTAVNGSAIGWAIRLNGSDITINYDASLFPGLAEPDVLMIH